MYICILTKQHFFDHPASPSKHRRAIRLRFLILFSICIVIAKLLELNYKIEIYTVYNLRDAPSLSYCLISIIGVNDFTRCFFCAGGLRDWEPNDIPWIEHARWYENCVFVRQCKGEEFVNLVKQGRIEEATQIVRK